ncbi:hypothetical protein SCLCIDRAFT_1224011 [Scleroderma citrinum Foug A]|uniref:Uncharacterized protein n=1 Tax=Scleroderma citrinum Foug A TaxID=1036808 RepID=A0A0C3D6W8_9AGAM|nr:hypothetical protein SCLCIDRAFT_1224011 [Scleroderma citrinum Foug A]
MPAGYTVHRDIQDCSGGVRQALPLHPSSFQVSWIREGSSTPHQPKGGVVNYVKMGKSFVAPDSELFFCLRVCIVPSRRDGGRTCRLLTLLFSSFMPSL